MEIKVFMGYELPSDVGFEVYVNNVSFYRKRGKDDGWRNLGSISKPYNPQPPSWWKSKLDQILSNT
jgi:hypothetical protein